MSDLLLQSALAYRVLMDYEYTFLLGRKGVSHELHLTFPEVSYHHLAGFQYAKDIPQLTIRKEALQKVLVGKVDFALLRKSSGYPLISNRLPCICQLSNMIQNNRLVFRYAGYERPGSQIDATYLLTDARDQSVVLFFTNGETSQSQVPVSIFSNREDTYSKKCPKYTTLRIEARNITTGETKEIYRSASYKEQ